MSLDNDRLANILARIQSDGRDYYVYGHHLSDEEMGEVIYAYDLAFPGKIERVWMRFVPNGPHSGDDEWVAGYYYPAQPNGRGATRVTIASGCTIEDGDEGEDV